MENSLPVLIFWFQMILRHKECASIKTHLLAFVVLICAISSASAVAVMSVDLGTEWMKVAVVSVSLLSPPIHTNLYLDDNTLLI